MKVFSENSTIQSLIFLQDFLEHSDIFQSLITLNLGKPEQLVYEGNSEEGEGKG